jgi:hypothetical protein
MAGGAALPRLRWPRTRRPLALPLEPLSGLRQGDWVGPAVAEGVMFLLRIMRLISSSLLCFLMRV